MKDDEELFFGTLESKTKKAAGKNKNKKAAKIII